MSNVMMRLGTLKFSLSTAAYQEFQRTAQYRWARQERLGINDALQCTGVGPETITLRGVIFPAYRGSSAQVTLHRVQAELGYPLPLISGTGAILGLWVVEEITESQSVFAIKGVAMKVEFDLKLIRYSPSLTALAKSYLGI